MDTTKIVELWSLGKSAKEIATILNVSERVVWEYVSRHRDLCPKRYGRIQHDEFVKLWNNKKNFSNLKFLFCINLIF